MAYQDMVNLIRDTAISVNQAGSFIHARRTDASIEFKGEMPQIHLYPVNSSAAIADAFTETYDIVMGFWYQDKPDSSPVDREEIIAEADELSREFILALDANETVEITSIVKEPNYRQLSGTLSGYIIRFSLTLTTSVC